MIIFACSHLLLQLLMAIKLQFEVRKRYSISQFGLAFTPKQP